MSTMRGCNLGWFAWTSQKRARGRTLCVCVCVCFCSPGASRAGGFEALRGEGDPKPQYLSLMDRDGRCAVVWSAFTVPQAQR